jgi:putative phosphoribosyl transferase
MRLFRDRREAGLMVADLVAGCRFEDPVVLALPRGGVPVGLEVARRLNAPLDLVMVRKIGVPYQPELAAGAVVNGDSPEIVVNENVAGWAGLGRGEIEALGRIQLDEIARRRALYLAGRDSVPVAGRTAIVVDDGIATWATMRAALRGVHRRGPARLVLAVPVAAPATLADLHAEVDDIVCVERPPGLGAIGAFYADFTQVGDTEVIAMLDEAHRLQTEAAAARQARSETD